MSSSSELIDPIWIYITIGVVIALVGGVMWWAGILKR